MLHVAHSAYRVAISEGVLIMNRPLFMVSGL